MFEVSNPNPSTGRDRLTGSTIVSGDEPSCHNPPYQTSPSFSVILNLHFYFFIFFYYLRFSNRPCSTIMTDQNVVIRRRKRLAPYCINENITSFLRICRRKSPNLIYFIIDASFIEIIHCFINVFKYIQNSKVEKGKLILLCH